MTTTEILLTIGVVTFIIYAIFNIIYLLDLRKTSFALRHFIIKTEENLNPALAELTRTLEEMRKVTGDAAAFVERARAALGMLVSAEKAIQGLYGRYREGFGNAAQANIEGLKAGVKTGLINLFRNLKMRKEGTS